ncbi:hypothetical protein P255_02863 [Acinetobacter brisouii CIP 110357]|uniref:Immunity protein 30 domain-containing protein n=1 Tax=Acinetobacter brisouii CIP 110357 TaxID=1341683 RepID=V2UHT4_9GAMM|nr:hypothetical protein [Acinetobacter brisouii]ENV48805.1 hypothetical protein F954_00195 [Acinetobacter brisouii ANC 4119]ESK48220.1 hypothetical protein P255_02863 [Acinetobacter brisouii CIP 110357]
MFIDSLMSFLQKINAESELEEWYLSNFIDEFVCKLSPPDAFEMSSYVIEVIKNDSKFSYTYELLTILLALQRQSNTAQIPVNLINEPQFLNEIIENSSEEYVQYLVDELAKNYKINSKTYNH